MLRWKLITLHLLAFKPRDLRTETPSSGVLWRLMGRYLIDIAAFTSNSRESAIVRLIESNHSRRIRTEYDRSATWPQTIIDHTLIEHNVALVSEVGPRGPTIVKSIEFNNLPKRR